MRFGGIVSFAREPKHPLVWEVIDALNADPEVKSLWESEHQWRAMVLLSGGGADSPPDAIWIENFLLGRSVVHLRNAAW